MNDDRRELRQWRTLGELLGRLARGDLPALDELDRLVEREDVAPEVAEAAEDVGLILVKLEGKDYALSVARDATTRLRELNDLKSRHLGIAAHDLRNPIGAIHGLAKRAGTEDLEAEKRRTYLASIVEISKQMLALLESLLDVSVIESGRMVLNLSRDNLGELARERGNRATDAAVAKGIELVQSVAAVPDSLFDGVRMGQVLDNLLSNAVKFSYPDSTVRLECEVRGSHVEIRVGDQGPGIPNDELTKIFDPYHRSSARPTGGEKSTGLGLSIVRPIVDAHGGSLEVASTVGEGTTFTIRMPLEAPGAA